MAYAARVCNYSLQVLSTYLPVALGFSLNLQGCKATGFRQQAGREVALQREWARELCANCVGQWT